MEPAIEAVLAEYEARQAEEDVLLETLSAQQIADRRDELLVSVGRATGELLNRLVRESRACALLELGTAWGYSTIWLAEAARATGGRVVTVDRSRDKQERARGALERTGLADHVEFWHGDALDFLHAASQRFDFVLLDVWKDLYIPCVDALVDRLASEATIVADNMLQPAMVRLAGARYQAHLRTITGMDTVLLTVGSGLAVSRYRAASLA